MREIKCSKCGESHRFHLNYRPLTTLECRCESCAYVYSFTLDEDDVAARYVTGLIAEKKLKDKRIETI